METTDLTIQILREIRDEIRSTKEELKGEIRQTNARLDQTNARLDQTNARLDQANARLDRVEKRQVDSETRLATELVAVVHAVDRVKELLADRLDVKKQVDDHERRLTTIEGHLGH